MNYERSSASPAGSSGYYYTGAGGSGSGSGAAGGAAGLADPLYASGHAAHPLPPHHYAQPPVQQQQPPQQAYGRNWAAAPPQHGGHYGDAYGHRTPFGMPSAPAPPPQHPAAAWGYGSPFGGPDAAVPAPHTHGGYGAPPPLAAGPPSMAYGSGAGADDKRHIQLLIAQRAVETAREQGSTTHFVPCATAFDNHLIPALPRLTTRATATAGRW